MTFLSKYGLNRAKSLMLKALLPLVFLSLWGAPALEGEAELLSDASEWNYAASHRDAERVLDVLKAYQTGLDNKAEKKLAYLIAENSRTYALDLNLVLAIIKTESNFDTEAVSRKGAVGLMQINLATGERLAADMGVEWKGEATLKDPFINVRLGIRYLNDLLARYKHDMDVAVAAYNFGPSGLIKRMRDNPEVRPGFVDRVYANYDGLNKVYSL